MVEREEVERTLQAVKDANCVAFRLHTQPWQKLYYDVADEMGLLIVVEGAIWCDQAYRFKDPKFWENYATHLRRTVANLKNHPSVIMWSLENEILHCAPAGKESPAKDGLADMGRLVKKLDPTRPITYESDIDPRGVADVVGLHYPWPEYPRVNQYPNVCYWVDKEIAIMPPRVDDKSGKWRWDRRKPLYIGEFLWVPARDPSPATIFFGDNAYADFSKYHILAKAESWRMQIEAYRWHGVNGICPWTMFEGPGGVQAREKNPLWVAVRDKFQPNAVFVKEYDTRFYAGDEVTRTLTAYNDTFSDGEFTLKWSFECGGRTVADGTERVKLTSATHRTFSAQFRAPEVSEPTDARLKISLLRDKVCFEDAKAYRVYPQTKLALSTPCALGLYDPEGTIGKLLAADGVSFTKVKSLEESPGEIGVLIIGERALEKVSQKNPGREIGRPNPVRDRLMEFVRNGGRVLVLAQKTYPTGLLPVQLSDYASTMTFAQMPAHPILKGVSAEDLEFWRGDHLVSQNEVLRPTTGGYRPMIVSGSESGLSHCPLMELPRGKGTLLLCQLRIGEKIATEPVAKRLMQNMLDYLAAFAPDTKATCVVSESADFKDLLTGLHAQADDLTGKAAGADLARYGLLVTSGAVKEIAAAQKDIRSFLESGGRVLFHGLSPEDMAKLAALFGQDVMIQAHRGRVSSIVAADPLTSGWTRESLYWLGKHEGPGHARTPLADGVADFAVVSKAKGTPVLRLQAKEMTIEGHLVRAVEDHVGMHTNGSAAKDVEIPEDGRYGIILTAKGTPAASVWPLMEVAVDGEVVGVASAPGREWVTVSVPCEVKKGVHALKVSFVNDYNKEGEDRNLFLKEVGLSRMPPGAEGFVGLTRPAFVARFNVGKGFAVVDEIAWDNGTSLRSNDNSRNSHKALQYAQGLLTAMGADFEDPACDVIGPDQMHEDKTMAHFNRKPDHVALASAGYVTIAARFATGGRYRFDLIARGTPLDNVYPIVDVMLDGKKAGTIQLKSEAWRSYRLDVEVAEGDHQLKLVYTNDEYRPPLDRNLYVQKLMVYRK